MLKVSVIVPVYNAKEYMEKCLETLINQTLKEIEIIIVNDGSTDNTAETIKRYQKKYSQIKSYYKANGGQSSARNLGLTKATGEYVSFIDADDYVEYTMLEKLYQKAKKDDLDVCLCAINYVYDSHTEAYHPFDSDKISKKAYITTNPAPWNKLFRREMLLNNHFAFPEGIIYEDYSVMPRIALWANKIGYVDECLYNYVIHENSTMNMKTYNPKINSIFRASEELYNYFKETNNLDAYHNEIEKLFIHHLLYNGSLRFYSFKRVKEIKEISNMMHKCFPNWKKNATYNDFSKKDKLILNLFYHKQIWLLNILTGVKRIFK